MAYAGLYSRNTLIILIQVHSSTIFIFAGAVSRIFFAAKTIMMLRHTIASSGEWIMAAISADPGCI